jgi:hypothetical protein
MYLCLSDDSERHALTMRNDSHKSRAGTMFCAKPKTMKLKPRWEMGTLPGALPRAGMLRALGASTWLSSQLEKTVMDRFVRQARAGRCIFASPMIPNGAFYHLVLERTNRCPPQKRAASTRSTATNKDGFVEATPSRSRRAFSVNRVLRDGVGTFFSNRVTTRHSQQLTQELCWHKVLRKAENDEAEAGLGNRGVVLHARRLELVS